MKNKLPCKECIVLAICKNKYTRESGGRIICSILWEYVVDDTSMSFYKADRSDWMASKERKIRSIRIKQVSKLFGHASLSFGGDNL